MRDKKMDFDNAGKALANLLSDDSKPIPYRKVLNKITGSVTASILLQQVIFRYVSNKKKPFYKFKKKCSHRLCREDDTWVYELGFTAKEFDRALSKIATKITTGVSKTEVLTRKDSKSLVLYWTDSNRLTWYTINDNLLGKSLLVIYLEDYERELT